MGVFKLIPRLTEKICAGRAKACGEAEVQAKAENAHCSEISCRESNSVSAGSRFYWWLILVLVHKYSIPLTPFGGGWLEGVAKCTRGCARTDSDENNQELHECRLRNIFKLDGHTRHILADAHFDSNLAWVDESVGSMQVSVSKNVQWTRRDWLKFTVLNTISVHKFQQLS